MKSFSLSLKEKHLQSLKKKKSVKLIEKKKKVTQNSEVLKEKMGGCDNTSLLCREVQRQPEIESWSPTDPTHTRHCCLP